MEDPQIVELFWNRSEAAIDAAAKKYGKYCHYIAYQILQNDQDSEECVNDAYLRAWNAIPPQRPNNLSTFLGKITRNLALDRYRSANREKRGGGQTLLALEELEECIPAAKDAEQAVQDKALAEALNRFLAGLPPQKRKIFVRRYWYVSAISDIAREFRLSQSNVKVMLLRTRRELKQYLEKEGISL